MQVSLCSKISLLLQFSYMLYAATELQRWTGIMNVRLTTVHCMHNTTIVNYVSKKYQQKAEIRKTMFEMTETGASAMQRIRLNRNFMLL